VRGRAQRQHGDDDFHSLQEHSLEGDDEGHPIACGGFTQGFELGDGRPIDRVLVVLGLVTARTEQRLTQPLHPKDQQDGTDHDPKCAEWNVNEGGTKGADQGSECQEGDAHALECRLPSAHVAHGQHNRERLDHLDGTRQKHGADEHDGRRRGAQRRAHELQLPWAGMTKHAEGSKETFTLAVRSKRRTEKTFVSAKWSSIFTTCS
jgi:hypothetical protein